MFDSPVVEKKHIYVPIEFAEEYEKLEGVEGQEASVKRLLERKGLDLDAENEMLGESLLEFKSVCLAHRKELEKVYSDETSKLEQLWMDMGDVGSTIRKHSKDIASEVDDVTKSIDDTTRKVLALKAAIENMNVYGAERIVSLAETISNMDEKSKSILSFMVENYKFEDK